MKKSKGTAPVVRKGFTKSGSGVTEPGTIQRGTPGCRVVSGEDLRTGKSGK